MKNIQTPIKQSIEVKQKILADQALLNTIQQVVAEIVKAFTSDHKVLFCGNGGSAADAQHLAAEFTGKFYLERAPLFAEALHVNTSYLTAVANDYSYTQVFERLVRAKGKGGDVLVGISTSGNSKNIIQALEYANSIHMLTVGLIGGKGGKMQDHCKYAIRVPSEDTPRIQEAHILIGHIICELVEKEIFSDKASA